MQYLVSSEEHDRSPSPSMSAPPLYPKQTHVSNPINALWCLLSLMVGGMSTFAFVQPFWVLEPGRPDCFGVYSYCVKDRDNLHLDRQLCGIYGGNSFSLQNLPSDAWRACCVLYANGCLLHLLCSLASLISLCLPRYYGKQVAKFTGAAQAVAVVLSILGLIAFPAGFSSPFVRYYCQSSAFNPGICEVGWGYLLAIMAAALSLFCPILAQFYHVHVCERRYHLPTSSNEYVPVIHNEIGRDTCPSPPTHLPPPPHLRHLGFYPDGRSLSNVMAGGSVSGSVVMGTPGGAPSSTGHATQYTAATLLPEYTGHYKFSVVPGYSPVTYK